MELWGLRFSITENEEATTGPNIVLPYHSSITNNSQAISISAIVLYLSSPNPDRPRRLRSSLSWSVKVCSCFLSLVSSWTRCTAQTQAGCCPFHAAVRRSYARVLCCRSFFAHAFCSVSSVTRTLSYLSRTSACPQLTCIYLLPLAGISPCMASVYAAGHVLPTRLECVTFRHSLITAIEPPSS